MRALYEIRAHIKIAFCTLLLLCISTESVAQQDINIDSVIVSVAELYKDLGAYYFEADVSIRMRRGRQTQTTSYGIRMAQELPSRYLIEIGGEKARSLVANDSMTWAFHPESGQYWMNRGAIRQQALRTDFPDPVRTYARLDQIVDSARLIAADTSYVLGEEKRPAFLVEVAPRTAEQAAGQTVTTLLWIDRDYRVVLQARTTSFAPNSSFGSTSIRQTTSYKSINISGDIPDSLFVFVPPDSAIHVGQIEALPNIPRTLYGKKAELFSLQELQSGIEKQLAEYAGKVIVLNFWATWCGPCRAEMGVLNRLYSEWGEQGLVVLAINEEEAPEQVIPYVRGEGLDFTVLLDRLGLISRQYSVYELPTTFIIDRNGIVRAHWVGARSEDDFRKEIGRWLN